MSNDIMPKKCEACGGENLVAWLSQKSGKKMYCCLECYYTRSLSKEINWYDFALEGKENE